jgi:hypothetical protein
MPGQCKVAEIGRGFERYGLLSTAERYSDLGKQRTIIGTIYGQDGKLLVVW